MIGLTNSKGLKQILQFDGLGLKITVVPSVETLGEPIVTRQAFYFLGDIEAVAKTRLKEDSVLYEWLKGHQREAVMEYILDNYLFEYSILSDESKITSKVTTGKLLDTTPRNWYFLADKGNAQYLAVDTLNDESVILCEDTSDPKMSFESDWRLFNNYFMGIYDKYTKEVESLFGREVLLKTKSDSTTRNQTLLIVRFFDRPYKYWEIEQISYIDYVDKNDVNLKNGIYEYYPIPSDNKSKIEVPMRHVFCTSFYHKHLLDIYFAALREHSFTVQYKHFYNLLEYFFEDATLLKCKKHLPKKIAEPIVDLSDWKKWKVKLDSSFRYNKEKICAEETQLKILMNLFIDKAEFLEKVDSFEAHIRNHFLKPLSIGNAMKIRPLNLNGDDILDQYSERVYYVRNSVVHTKRTRYGKIASTILPFSETELLLEREIPLLKFVAQKVVLKEQDTFGFTTQIFSPFEAILLINLLFENHNYEAIIKNLEGFLSNLYAKLDETLYQDFLDEILKILVDIADEARLDGCDSLNKVRDGLRKIKVSCFDEITRLVINSLNFLLQEDMDNFEESVRKLPRITMRANLYGLQTGLKFFYSQQRKENSKKRNDI